MNVFVEGGLVGRGPVLFGIRGEKRGCGKLRFSWRPSARRPKLCIDVATRSPNVRRRVRTANGDFEGLLRRAIFGKGRGANEFGVARFSPTTDLVQVPKEVEKAVHATKNIALVAL